MRQKSAIVLNRLAGKPYILHAVTMARPFFTDLDGNITEMGYLLDSSTPKI